MRAELYLKILESKVKIEVVSDTSVEKYMAPPSSDALLFLKVQDMTVNGVFNV